VDSEIIDDPALPDELMDIVYADLAWTHRVLGNRRALLSALRNGVRPARRVLDIGCGRGQLLIELRRKLGVEVIGVELRDPSMPIPGVPILRADAVRDPLPRCDTAIAVCVAHHLSDDELVELIRNVGRFCGRFLILDLVRHTLPLVLFRMFVAPFIHPVNAADGARSIQRSFTPLELGSLVRRAVQESGASFRHHVNPLRIRQLVDITY
jgi:SAM-dependent methyltransferase